MDYQAEECLEGSLKEWLRKAYDTAQHRVPSWERLVVAVANPVGGDNPALAERIAKRHNGML